MESKGFFYVFLGIIIFSISFIVSYEIPTVSTAIYSISWIIGFILIILGAYQVNKSTK